IAVPLPIFQHPNQQAWSGSLTVSIYGRTGKWRMSGAVTIQLSPTCRYFSAGTAVFLKANSNQHLQKYMR
ncbi:MAG: hypothetical protein CSA19_02215, partial [Deltaproteobacteria bacterium]